MVRRFSSILSREDEHRGRSALSLFEAPCHYRSASGRLELAPIAAMGQHCSCLEHPPKYQRRQSDDLDTVDMERSGDDDDDDDQELEVFVDAQESHELLGARPRTGSGGRGSQRGVLKRSGSCVAAGLMTGVDRRGDEDEEKESEEQHMRRSLSIGLMGLAADQHLTPSPRPEELSRLLRSYQEITGVVSWSLRLSGAGVGSDRAVVHVCIVLL